MEGWGDLKHLRVMGIKIKSAACATQVQAQ